MLEAPEHEILRQGELARKLNGETVSWELRQVSLTADSIIVSNVCASSSTGADWDAKSAGNVIRESIPLLDITSVTLVHEGANAEGIQQAHGSEYEGGEDNGDSVTRRLKSIESFTHEHLHKVSKRGSINEYVNCFQLHVSHLGRTYYFRASTSNTCRIWVKAIEDARSNACRRYEAVHVGWLPRWRMRADKLFNSNFCHNAIALIIISNFITNICEAEVAPTANTPARELFDNLDLIFAMIYCVELGVSMFVNGRRFWGSFYNLFDFVIVLSSLVELFWTLAGKLRFGPPNSEGG